MKLKKKKHIDKNKQIEKMFNSVCEMHLQSIKEFTSLVRNYREEYEIVRENLFKIDGLKNLQKDIEEIKKLLSEKEVTANGH